MKEAIQFSSHGGHLISIGITDETNYDSEEEKYFDWWAEELMLTGYIKSLFSVLSMNASPELEILIQSFNRLGEKWTSKALLQSVSYTPDRVIIWDERSKNLFKRVYSNNDGGLFMYSDQNEKAFFYAFSGVYDEEPILFSVIDIKPSYVGAHNSSGLTFPLKQHLMFLNYGLYVQKCVLFPGGKKRATARHLFSHTFTPDRYLLTDVTMKLRKIGYETRSLKQFLNSH